MSEGMRERVRTAIANWSSSSIREVEEITDAVLAALAGDPGDLPARMATAIGEALNQWSRPDAEGTRGVRRWDFIAAAAMSVRDEQLAHETARAVYAEGQMSALRDHGTRWEAERARADKAERRLELAHKARQTAEERLDACRKALADDNYFAEIEIGSDVAPRLIERLAIARETEEYAATVKAQVAALQRELAELHAGEADDPGEPGTWPTPAQWIRRWNDMTPKRRLEIAGGAVDGMQVAAVCRYQPGHEGQIAGLRTELVEARAAIERIATTGYTSTRALVADLAELAAALDAPQHPEGARPAEHIGGRANAEDCPACSGMDLPYPWICPGNAPDSPAAARTAVSAATEAHGGTGEAQEGSQWAS